MKLSHVVPVLATADIEAALTFCEQKLGFHREWSEGNPPTDAGVRRDGVGLIFALGPSLAERARDTTVMVFLTGIEELYAEHQARGAPIVEPIRDEDGLRSYTVQLPPGYRLRFAEGLGLIRQRGGRA